MLRCGRFELSLAKPLVMGVVNTTPDSFYPAARHEQSDAAIAHARQLLDEGADLIDIGAESTRPGAAPITQAQEWARLAPVLEALRGWPIPVSVDTRHASVMRNALALGVDMINDVSGFRDPASIQAVAASHAAVCVMHMAGEPATMQQAPAYRDVLQEVGHFLQQRLSALRAAGVSANRLVIDPGIGFGKNTDHNIALLRGLRALLASAVTPGLGNTPSALPVLVGLSRKSLIGVLTGRPVADRLVGSVVAAVAAAAQGAAIVRVHDVAATRDGLAVWQAIGLHAGQSRGHDSDGT